MEKLSHQLYFGDRHLTFKELHDFGIEREVELKAGKRNSYHFQQLKTPRGLCFQKITIYFPYLLPPKKAVVLRVLGDLVDGTVTYLYSHGKLSRFVLAAYLIKVEGMSVKDAANKFNVPYYWRLFLRSYKA